MRHPLYDGGVPRIHNGILKRVLHVCDSDPEANVEITNEMFSSVGGGIIPLSDGDIKAHWPHY